MKANYQIASNSALTKEDFDQLIKLFHHHGEVIDDRGRNLIKALDFKGKKINIKSFKPPHLINRIAYRYLRKSKAQRSFEYANRLLEKGIGTPEPLAYFEFATSLGLKQSYYFSEHLKYDLTYRELRPYPKYPDHERILREFTQFTFTLHEAGILFKDHSAGNTLIVKNQNDYDFYLIDLNRMVFKTLDFKERMQNFAKLTTDADMIRIMSEEYAKLSNLSTKTVYQAMVEETLRFRDKYDRRMRAKKTFLNKDVSEDLELHPNDIRIKDAHST